MIRWSPPHSPSPQQQAQVLQIPQQNDRPSSSIGLYDLGVRFGTYRNVMPSVETSMGDIPLFQTPHTSGFLSQEAEKDLLDCFSM
jgi:hypothetical protein